MDVFSWSMPFLAEKVVSMLYTIVKKGIEDEGEDIDLKEVLDKGSKMPSKNFLLFNIFIVDEKKANRGLVMKGKVMSVARMNKMFTVLR